MLALTGWRACGASEALSKAQLHPRTAPTSILDAGAPWSWQTFNIRAQRLDAERGPARDTKAASVRVGARLSGKHGGKQSIRLHSLLSAHTVCGGSG